MVQPAPEGFPGVRKRVRWGDVVEYEVTVRSAI